MVESQRHMSATLLRVMAKMPTPRSDQQDCDRPHRRTGIKVSDDELAAVNITRRQSTANEITQSAQKPEPAALIFARSSSCKG
jgi:hypothetical protein